MPAVEGTTCGSGKTCIQGVCTTTPNSLESVCPFGDLHERTSLFGINNGLIFITCPDLFRYLTQNGKSIVNYCKSTDGLKNCCSSCQSNFFFILSSKFMNLWMLEYRLITCGDQLTSCPQYKNICNGGYMEYPDGIKYIKDLCPYSCGICTRI